jgi:ABC-2 type transport system permease protein
MEGFLMGSLADMIWIEYKKATCSGMILWTVMASLLLPLGIAFLIFVSKNPEISQKLGLVSAKANLVAYAGTDWPMYAGLFGQVIGVGLFMFSVFIISWVFGREFSDGTVKDILAVPIPRWNILLAKFILVAVWSLLLTVVIYTGGLLVGMLLKLPGASMGAIYQGSLIAGATACLVIPVVMPYALFASIGRGLMLPLAVALITLMLVNLSVVVGRCE